MSNEKIINTLQQMKGGIFMFADQMQCIIDFRIEADEEVGIIMTNLSEYRRKFEHLPAFLNQWLLVDTSSGIEKSKPQEGVRFAIDHKSITGRFDKMIAALDDSISKVQKSPEYIPQAEAVNLLTQTIIKSTKLETDILIALAGI